jgi:hypothetical protein
MAHYSRTKKLAARNRRARIEERNSLVREILSRPKISRTDDTNYIPGKCCNGGAYRFIIDYIPLLDGKGFMIDYHTSSDFDYCPVDGQFQDCYKCHQWDNFLGKCHAPRKNISLGELVDKILNPTGYEKECIEDGTIRWNV